MHRFYVGANNESKVLELDKIKQIVSSYADGYTLIVGTGLWQGVEEPCAIVEVEGLPSMQWHALAMSLKKGLEQQSIGVLELNTLQFV